MGEMVDYYALLVVSRNATADEIKRAWHRKMREYQNDDEKKIHLTQAYEILLDPVKRKQYDLSMQFGNQLEEANKIKEKIRNSETIEQRDKYLLDVRKIYLDILRSDEKNEDALWNLVNIEELLENDTQAIQYLKQLESYAEGDDKLQVYHRMGEIYRKLGRIDEAIKCYYAIYKADSEYIEDIKILVRLCYEEKKNLKIAIQILNDCINRTSDSRLKIVYLCETLRAIRNVENSSYQKVEETLYKKLESFCTDNEETNLANATTILKCIGDLVSEEDFECFHKMEKVFNAYDVKNAELNQTFELFQKIVAFMEQGKLHRAIELYLEEHWTKEIREELGRLIIRDAEQIKVSLECIKKEIPEYWNVKQELIDLEKVVNENLKVSKEFNSLSKDRTISYYMKKMIECILLDGFVAIEDMKEEFIEARDSFFDEEDRDRFLHTLRKMEAYYPRCYELFSDIFFEGKSTDELNINSVEKEVEVVNTHNSEIEEKKDDGSVFDVILGLLALPIILVIGILAAIFSDGEKEEKVIDAEELARRQEEERRKKEEEERRQKEREAKTKKLIKGVAIIVGVLFLISIISETLDYFERKQQKIYEDAHDEWLNEEEKNQVEKLTADYNTISEVDIRVVQAHPDRVKSYLTGDYIWLVLWDYANRPDYELMNNYLSVDERDSLYQEIRELFNCDYTDIEKCEKFYELAHEYVVAHEANTVIMPNIVGMSVEQAEMLLNDNDLFMIVSNYEYSSEYDEDVIMYQYISQETELMRGQTIYVDVSLGEKKPLTVDNNIDGNSIFSGPYEVQEDDYFELQELCDVQREILTPEYVLNYLEINPNDCEINHYWNKNNVDETKDVIQWDASFYGYSGYVICEVYCFSEENFKYGRIDFTWYAYDTSNTFGLYYAYQDNRDYGHMYVEGEYNGEVFSSDNGNVLLEYTERGSYNKEIERVRFVKYAN